MNTNILRPIAEIQVSAWPEFDARKHFVAGYKKKGPEEIKISWIHEVFKEHYMGITVETPVEGGKPENKKGDQWLIEHNVRPRTIVVSELVTGARDPMVIAALQIATNNADGHIISLAHYFEILNRHPNGEYVKGEQGGLRVNHYDNLAYCKGWSGKLNSVTTDYFNPGWQVKSDPIDRPDENEADAADRLGSWRAGDYVLSYKH